MTPRRFPPTFELGITLRIRASSATEARARLENLLRSSPVVEAPEVGYCEEHVAIAWATFK